MCVFPGFLGSNHKILLFLIQYCLCARVPHSWLFNLFMWEGVFVVDQKMFEVKNFITILLLLLEKTYFRGELILNNKFGQVKTIISINLANLMEMHGCRKSVV